MQVAGRGETTLTAEIGLRRLTCEDRCRPCSKCRTSRRVTNANFRVLLLKLTSDTRRR